MIFHYEVVAKDGQDTLARQYRKMQTAIEQPV